MKEIIVDFDGTLTTESFTDVAEKEGISMDDRGKLKDIIANLTPKKGVEILKEVGVKPIVITGREEDLRDVSSVWLHANGISVKDMIMMPRRSRGSSFDWSEYVEYKIAAHRQYDVRFSLEDKKSLVTILNKVGIPAYLVEDDFGAVFEKAWGETA